MGRPKGHRMSPASRAKQAETQRRRWAEAKAKGARHGGRRKGQTPIEAIAASAEANRKPTIPRKHAQTPQEHLLETDALETGLSIVRPGRATTFKVRMPDGRTIVETLIPDKI